MPKLVKCLAVAACGHRVEKSLPRWLHRYWSARVAESDCIECQHQAESRRDALAAFHAGLPALVGLTERQRAYGETCRANVLNGIYDLMGREPVDDGGLTTTAPPDDPKGRGHMFQLLQYLDEKREAGWWCEVYQRYRSAASGSRSAVLTYVMADMRLCSSCWQIEEQPEDEPMPMAAAEQRYVCGGCRTLQEVAT